MCEHMHVAVAEEANVRFRVRGGRREQCARVVEQISIPGRVVDGDAAGGIAIVEFDIR